MRETQADTVHPNELASDHKFSDNDFSSNGLLALKDNKLSAAIGVEQSSMSSMLPNLTLEDNTAHAARTRTEQHLQAGAEQTRPLTAQERRTADSIERSILTGDLRTLQDTMNRYSGRGQELEQVMTKVERDMDGHGWDMTFWTSHNQLGFIIGGPYDNYYSLQVSTDRRYPATGGFFSNQTGPRLNLDPQKVLDKLRRR